MWDIMQQNMKLLFTIEVCNVSSLFRALYKIWHEYDAEIQ